MQNFKTFDSSISSFDVMLKNFLSTDSQLPLLYINDGSHKRQFIGNDVLTSRLRETEFRRF